jgi:hypothetical protein
MKTPFEFDVSIIKYRFLMYLKLLENVLVGHEKIG